MGRKKQFPDSPDKTNTENKRVLRFRTASYKGVLDDVLSFFQAFQDVYGKKSIFYLTAFLTRNINEILQETHDGWLLSCYKDVQKSTAPALHASVVSAIYVQKYGDDALSNLPSDLAAFDEKYNTNSCAILMSLFPTAGYRISPEVEYAIRNKDYPYLLEVINNSNDTEELFYFVSYCRLKDNVASLSAAALSRLKIVSADKFYDYCLDYESKFQTLIVDEIAKEMCPSYSARAIVRPSGLSITSWNIIIDGLRDIFNNNCPDKFKGFFNSDLIYSEASRKAEAFKANDKRKKDIISASIPDLDFQITNLFSNKSKGVNAS